MTLAIDFGSHTTKIYILGCGVVLSEATCVAVEEQKTNQKLTYYVKSYGNKARALFGKAAQNTHIINPVQEGDITNEKLAAALLEHFLNKIEISPRKAKKCEVIFILPCGSSKDLRNKYLSLAARLNLGKVYFTQTPFAAALGHNAIISQSNPVLSVDIGYGITNIAAFSLDGIISGLSINLGGGNVDVHIMDYIAEDLNLKIGALTAEKIKNTVGSLIEEENKVIVVDGRDLSEFSPASVAINSSNVYEIFKVYINKIIEYINLTISKLPAEVATNIMRSGVYLSGGLCKIEGLCDYISNAIKMPVNCVEDAQYAAVIGAGMILSSDDLLAYLATED